MAIEGDTAGSPALLWIFNDRYAPAGSGKNGSQDDYLSDDHGYPVPLKNCSLR